MLTQLSLASKQHSVTDLIVLFDQAFLESENTRLVRGDIEPIYLPASGDIGYHQIVFAHGFFSSAMHEIAHWCQVGAERRKQVDFGYWYRPDGRTNEEQALFEQVEVVPQAFEWILSMAAGYRFRVSADNLNGEYRDNSEFKARVFAEVERRFSVGLPPRLEQFVGVLQEFYTPDEPVCFSMFLLEDL